MVAEPVRHRTVMPGPDEKQEFSQLFEVLSQVGGELRLRAQDGHEVGIPASLLRILRDAVRELNRGRSVRLEPASVDLTTQQAADLLNISRPTLIKLLEQGELKSHDAGRHRRIPLEDVLRYRDARSRRRRSIFKQMVVEGETSGLYKD